MQKEIRLRPLPRGFHMEYPELAQELYVGGIYIRLYLKDPKFPLRNPKDSLEGCLKMFFVEAKYEQDRLAGKEVKRNDDEDKYVDATQPDNLKENVLSTITSGIACLLKSTPTLSEHVAMLDYPKKLVALLKVAVKLAPQSDLTMSVIRIMHDVGVRERIENRSATTRPARRRCAPRIPSARSARCLRSPDRTRTT